MSDFPFVSRDIPIRTKPKTVYTRSGAQVTYQQKQMIPIQRFLMEDVFYLYRDVIASDDAEHYGATGFFAQVPTEKGENVFYAVTNKHVTRQNVRVVRVNLQGGGSEPIDLTDAHW